MRKQTSGSQGLATVIGIAVLAGCEPAGASDGAFHWSISTQREIAAAPDAVYAALVDFESYRAWNPFIVEASGRAEAGQTLSLRMALPGEEPRRVEPVLLRADAPRELRWRGKVVVPGLFDAEHVFLLRETPDGHTRLEHSEQISGLLLPFLKGMKPRILAAFESMNAALATRVEAAPER